MQQIARSEAHQRADPAHRVLEAHDRLLAGIYALQSCLIQSRIRAVRWWRVRAAGVVEGPADGAEVAIVLRAAHDANVFAGIDFLET